MITQTHAFFHEIFYFALLYKQKKHPRLLQINKHLFYMTSVT